MKTLRIRKRGGVRSKKVNWSKAPDIKRRINFLIDELNLDWIEKSNIYSFRSKNSKTRSYARIWGLTRIWQQALNQEPGYIIEVISERFDQLDKREKDKILIHELTHIPQTFSGSLTPHFRKGKRKFEDKVRVLVAQYFERVKEK